jgi:hypothetical protein
MHAAAPTPQPGQGTPDVDVKPKRSFFVWWGAFMVLFITLLAMVTVHLLARLGAEVVHVDAAPVSNVQPPVGLSFPGCGVMLKTPPQWSQVPPDRANIAVRWISPGSSADNVSGAVAIEVVKPSVLDVKRVAAVLARRWHGELVDKSESLDGEPACRIVAPVSENLQPVEGLVCIHEGRLYLIEGDVTDGHACHDQIEMIRQGWAWIPLSLLAKIGPPAELDPLAKLDSPLNPLSKRRDFRYQPITIFNGKVSVDFPTAMPEIDDTNPGKILFSLHNYEHDHADFLAFVQPGGLLRGDTLAAVAQRVGAIVHTNGGFSGVFVWHSIKSDSARGLITQPLAAPPGGRPYRAIVAVVLLPDNKLVLANFVISTLNDDDLAFYTQTAETIMGTVKLSPEGSRDLERQKHQLDHPPLNARTASRGFNLWDQQL